MTAKGCASVVRTAVLAATLGGGIEAIDLELSQAEMEEVLTIARGPAAAREAFHAAYRLLAPPAIEPAGNAAHVSSPTPV